MTRLSADADGRIRRYCEESLETMSGAIDEARRTMARDGSTPEECIMAVLGALRWAMAHAGGPLDIAIRLLGDEERAIADARERFHVPSSSARP